LREILKDADIARQTQSYFLFKEAAATLCSVIVGSVDKEPAIQAYRALLNVLSATEGDSHRATAEALGSLPFMIHGPELSDKPGLTIPNIKWRGLIEEKGLTPGDVPSCIGRSLVAAIGQNAGLLVIKMAGAQDSLQSLYREAAWMEHLSSPGYSLQVRFDIPATIRIQGSHVFRLEDVPVGLHQRPTLHPERYAIGFVAHKDYFAYPNGNGVGARLGAEQFREAIFRNAWLFGKLASLGIVHSAPIPVFHNRVQRFRRADNGLYDWQRAGRLDRWLDSCRHPNFGLTGIRDFEHIIPFKGPCRELYRYLGIHFLSLFLVIGSYFRNKEKDRVGFDLRGKPVDARDLFDIPLLKELMHGVFVRYYHGFVGKEFDGQVPVDLDQLSDRMVDEMGVDRHMEEVLRVIDQREMTEEDFMNFLDKRGYTKDGRRFQRGREDITIHTGPHLGEFNQRISLPELIEAVGGMSALCISGKYWTEKFPKNERNQ
jgi:hypothetical protein